jgi:Zn-dependent alcohol dehydrogenase
LSVALLFLTFYSSSFSSFLLLFQAAKVRKASRIFAIDVNGLKFEHALKLGATECINPTELPTGVNIQSHIVTLTT